MNDSRRFGLRGTQILAMVLIILGIFAGIGWILNIVELALMPDVVTGMHVLRFIGIFLMPLGSVLGWMGVIIHPS